MDKPEATIEDLVAVRTLRARATKIQLLTFVITVGVTAALYFAP